MWDLRISSHTHCMASGGLENWGWGGTVSKVNIGTTLASCPDYFSGHVTSTMLTTLYFCSVILHFVFKQSHRPCLQPKTKSDCPNDELVFLSLDHLLFCPILLEATFTFNFFHQSSTLNPEFPLSPRYTFVSPYPLPEESPCNSVFAVFTSIHHNAACSIFLFYLFIFCILVYWKWPS